MLSCHKHNKLKDFESILKYMIFKTKFSKGLTPCNLCQIGSHSRCRKWQHCSCNCPNEFKPRIHSNQNTKKTHCIRGHLLEGENLYIDRNGKHRVCRKCWPIRRENNRKNIRQQAKDFYQRHKKEIAEERKRAFPEKIEKFKIEVLTYYGNGKLVCVCCGETILKFLTIDHINGRVKGDEKRGIHMYEYLKWTGFPTGFQTLCFNCNQGRSMNDGICPHKNIVDKEVLLCLN